MAIRFEFCNVVVSVHEIETKFPGGFREYEKLDPSGLSWHDGVILRLGSMGDTIPTVDILENTVFRFMILEPLFHKDGSSMIHTLHRLLVP